MLLLHIGMNEVLSEVTITSTPHTVAERQDHSCGNGTTKKETERTYETNKQPDLATTKATGQGSDRIGPSKFVIVLSNSIMVSRFGACECLPVDIFRTDRLGRESRVGESGRSPGLTRSTIVWNHREIYLSLVSSM